MQFDLFSIIRSLNAVPAVDLRPATLIQSWEEPWMMRLSGDCGDTDVPLRSPDWRKSSSVQFVWRWWLLPRRSSSVSTATSSVTRVRTILRSNPVPAAESWSSPRSSPGTFRWSGLSGVSWRTRSEHLISIPTKSYSGSVQIALQIIKSTNYYIPIITYFVSFISLTFLDCVKV